MIYDKRQKKMTPEQLQEFLKMRNRASVVPPKKGKRSKYKRKSRNNNRDIITYFKRKIHMQNKFEIQISYIPIKEVKEWVEIINI